MLHDHQTRDDLKPHTREHLERIHSQAILWAAESRAAQEYERALAEYGIAIPHEEPVLKLTFVERWRQAAVTGFLFSIAFFLHSWGVL